MRTGVVLVIGLAIQCIGVNAQPHRVGVDVGKSLPREEISVLRKLELARKANGPVSEDANAALRTALAAVRSRLQVEIPAPQRAATILYQDEDILIAEWPQVRPRPRVQPILLWDDSNSATIVLECSAAEMQSPRAVQKLIEDLAIWDEMHFAGARLTLKWPLSNGLILMGGAVHGGMAQFPISGASFSATLLGQRAYLTAAFRSNTGIKERFPPLKNRVCDWPTARVLSEVGIKPLHPDIDGSMHRDRVLIDELMRRPDFSAADFHKLLISNAGTFLLDNQPYSIGAAIKAGRVAEFRDAIQDPVSYNRRNFVLDGVLSMLSNDLSVDFVDATIDCVKRLAGPRKLCSAYLAARGNSERAYDAVKETVPDFDVSSADIKVALAQIAGRIH